MKSLEHSQHSTSEVTRYLPFSHSIPLSVCVCAEFMIWKFSLSWVPLISVETYTVRTSEQSKRFFISIETPGWQHCRGKPRIPHRRGHQLYKFARFSEKLNEIKKCLVRRRGRLPSDLPLHCASYPFCNYIHLFKIHGPLFKVNYSWQMPDWWYYI